MNWLGALSEGECRESNFQLTKSACKALLVYHQQFLYGIDFTDLPAGFVYKKMNNRSYLDFDKNAQQMAVPVPSKVQLREAISPKPVPISMLRKWGNSHPDHDFVTYFWSKLEKVPYDRKSYLTVGRFFPSLLHLNQDQLSQLSQLCFSNNEFKVDNFEFLMENPKQLKKLIKSKAPFALDKLNNLFPDQMNQLTVSLFINNYPKEEPTFESHLFATLIDENKAMFTKVKEVLSNLPDVNLNGLMQLYIERGEPGINAFIALVNEHKELMQQLNKHVFSQSNSYAQIVEEDYKNAITTIAGFAPNERVWWNSLLAQHCEEQTNVNLIDLVNAFKEFNLALAKIKIANGVLALPDTCSLVGVKSLPIALSRILTLINHCDSENRKEQLLCMDQLDLSSNGVIKPISAETVNQWAFITPEMGVNAAKETNTFENKKINKYAVAGIWGDIYTQTIAAKELEPVTSRFFRFVAVQENHGQLPLDFYQHAHQQLIAPKYQFTLLEQKYLYTLIAGATTGKRLVEQIDVAHANQTIDIFLKRVQDSIGIPLFNEPVRLEVLKQLIALEVPPPLAMLEQIISVIFSSATSITYLPRLEKANKNLQEKVKAYGTSVYLGMKDYSKESFKNKELFFTHLSILDEIVSQNISNAKYTMALISSFNISKADIADIKAKYDTLNPQVLTGVLILLGDLSTKDKKKLTKTDFDRVLKQFEGITDPNDVIALINTTKLADGEFLKNYLPQAKLAQYGKKFSQNELMLKLHTCGFTKPQSEKILELMLRFKASSDNKIHIEVIDKISAICKPLDLIERDLFINKLYNAEGLYNKRMEIGSEDSHFIPFLDAVLATRSTDPFINLIAGEHEFVERGSPAVMDKLWQQNVINKSQKQKYSVNDLAQKATILMTSLLPGIQTIKPQALSLIDVTQRFHSMVLSTQIISLNTSDAELEEEESYASLEKSLQQGLDAIRAGKEHKVDVEQSINDRKIPLADSMTINFDDLTQKTNAYTQQVNSNQLANDYTKTLTECTQVKEVSQQDQKSLKANIAQFLVQYFLSPESVEGAMKAHIERHPKLLSKMNFIVPLLNNDSFLNKLLTPEVISAAKNPDLLSNEKLIDVVIEALMSDLTDIDQFEQQTSSLIEELKKQRRALHTYGYVSLTLFKKIDHVVLTNPGIKAQFLDLFDSYLGAQADNQKNLPGLLLDFVTMLDTAFALIEDKNTVLSLCLLFKGETADELQPESLISLLKLLGQNDVKAHKDIILKIFVNDGHLRKQNNYDAQIKELATLMNAKPEFAAFVNKTYEKAPYPSLETIKSWHKQALENATGTYQNNVTKLWNDFSKKPYEREERNGLKIEKAMSQRDKFKGFDFEESEIKDFQYFTNLMRDQTCEELLSFLQKFKDDADPSYEFLIAVAAELLYRSQGEEINTTQYLALLAELKTKGHVTAQIGTGEGKSRIMMIMNACQFALGQTVDFVTSDVQLATRDFVKYQPYFNMIGAKSTMIYADTPPGNYLKQGINFSDPSNLSLFRNKARSMGQSELIIDQDKTKRTLLLDEADKSYFDMANTRFNYSIEGDDSIRGMTWVYPILMDYFSTSEEAMKLYYSDVDASRKGFLAFAAGKCDKAQIKRLKALPNEQIEQWQVSAVTANQLQIDQDFVIEQDKLILTPFGPKISSEAQLLFGNRVAKNSKYSFGVHQCLHARLNKAKNDMPSVAADEALTKALQRCDNGFYIPDEKQIVYSSTSKNLLDDYQDGTLKAVTGTSGSLMEQQEANMLYQGMSFVEVPRHAGLDRRDRAIRLVKDNKQQIAALISPNQRSTRKKSTHLDNRGG